MSEFKKQAAEKAVEYITNNMVIGLGHGSTSIYALRKIALLIREGTLQNVRGIPCSRQTEAEARELGIPLTSLDETPIIDITIDGADEIDSRLNMIKGGGGALLREKIVAQASKTCIYIADESKCSEFLGEKWAVPVEVLPFGERSSCAFLESLGAHVTIRRKADGTKFLTDQLNLIADCNFGIIHSPKAIAVAMKSRAGIVEHGLFIGIASEIIIAGKDGIRTLKH
ncbi:MAG: ribose-5-phosphate isomerase RpiA [Ignavibacteria bacterium]|nr:ribose-5-phosphate isomerase RpiA [Ignavibacteria bacterium]